MSAADTSVLSRRIAALPDAVRREVGVALGHVGADVAAAARRALAGAAGARSTPGGPYDGPSGRLAAALDVVTDPDGPTATVVADIPYAVDLEYGTRTMAARPFLRPAVEATADDARRLLRDALARVISASMAGRS